MAENSGIAWTDATFNPWIGCTEVSPACNNCYARTLAERRGWAEWGAGKPRHRTSAANWAKPRAWDRKAAATGRRTRVFCASLADVFDVEVPTAWRAELFELIDETPNLEWLLLTKRPKVARDFFSVQPIYPSVTLGTTVENRDMAKLRIPLLRETRARKRFLSIEPLLEDLGELDLTGIDWVIVGGESGAFVRSMAFDWARSIKAQCQAAGVSFFFKQVSHPRPTDAMIPEGLRVREFPA